MREKQPDRDLGDKTDRTKTSTARGKASTPTQANLTDVLANSACQPEAMNSAVLRDLARQDMPDKEMPYNQVTDQGLASRRSKHILRSNDEVNASITGSLPAGDGLSLRAPMAGQGENDQFPWCTDRFGKQRS
jgi:hypothetical protein